MKSPLRDQKSGLPPLSSEQIAVLQRFLVFEAKIDDVRSSLAGVFDFDFHGRSRTASTSFRIPEPGVLVKRGHISNALDRRRLGLIPDSDLIEWATMLLLNDAFEVNAEDQDFIAEWLNETSFNGVAK